MFNLIATTFRHMEREASSELHSLLTEMRDAEPEINYTNISGVLTARTTLNPYKVIRAINKNVQEEPWSLRYIQRLIPIDVVVSTNIEDMQKAVSRLTTCIGGNETFRITVEKRYSALSSINIVETVAELIERKVNLSSPDWVVLIEIVGKETGISVIRPDAIFSAIKVKRELS